MKLLLLFIAGCLATTAGFSQQLKYTIAPWFDNKKAAVSLTLDDGIAGQYKVALPLLNRHGYKATFFVTVKIINDQRISWDLVREAAADGHEIANHALTHPHFSSIALDTIAKESVLSNELLNKYIPSQRVITHAYPFGDGGGNTDKDKSIRKTVARYFIGARATQNKPYPYNKYDFAAANDDYYNVNSQMITDSASFNGFGRYLDETIAIGGWFSPTYHGVADGWIITPAAVFENHLKELDKRKASLWVAPFKNVVQYHKERNSARLILVSKTATSWQLALSDTLSNRADWDQPLTINLHVSGRKIKSVMHGPDQLPFTVFNGIAVFNAVPGRQRITIKFAR
jgi:peptidoglycan/xylan/chitin deacetylase (PgdA/CDA1 family)